MMQKTTKSILLSFILLVSMLTTLPYANATYTTVTLSGFNADVVANGVGTPNTTTTNSFDNTAYCLLAQNYQQTSTSAAPTYYLPNNGTIASVVSATPGLNFQLAAYTGNNSLRLTSSSTSGSLTFSNNTYIGDVFVLAGSGDGYTTCTFTVNFVGGTTQVFTSQTISDWFGGSNYATQGIGRVQRNSPYALGATTVDPRLYQIQLPISISNYSKTIASITVTRTGGSSTSSVANIMAVSVDNQSCLPPQGLAVSSISTVGANISWNAVTGSAGYEYVVSTSSTTPSSGTFTTSTSYNPSGLNPGTTYYVFVRNKCSATSFSVWNTTSFTTLPCPSAGTPTITNNVPGTVTFSWPGTSTPGVTDYQYAVTQTTSAPPNGSWQTTSATSASVSGLTPGATYYAQVRTNCTSTLSGWLYVQFVNPFPPCLSPSIMAPTNINMHGASLKWTTGLNGIEYQYVVSPSPSLPTSGTTIPDTMLNLTGLAANTTYYVFVRTHCGTTNYSPWDSTHFTTPSVCLAPITPVITNVTANSAFASWNFYPGIMNYEYFINTTSTDPTFAGVPVSYNAIAPINLNSNTTYYLHLRTRCDSNSYSAWSSTPFTTLTICSAPSTPTISNLTSTTATFTWSSVSGAASYEYVLDTDPSDPPFGPATSLTTYTATNLTPSSNYYFHVRAYCSASDLSNWKTVNFTTLPTGVTNINGDDQFNIQAYPNPVSELLNLQVNGRMNKGAKIAMYDLSGKMILEKNLENDKVEINMNNIASGMYIVKYTDSERALILRIQKK